MAKVIVGVADTPAKDGVSSRYEQGGTCSETNRSELVPPHVGQRLIDTGASGVAPSDTARATGHDRPWTFRLGAVGTCRPGRRRCDCGIVLELGYDPQDHFDYNFGRVDHPAQRPG